MTDRPDAATLLRGMAATLTDQVLPTATGAAQHATRIVASLCRILEREWIAGDGGEAETRTAVDALLAGEPAGSEADSPAGWARRLDERLRSSDAVFDREAGAILRADVRRRLDVNRPGYGS